MFSFVTILLSLLFVFHSNAQYFDYYGNYLDANQVGYQGYQGYNNYYQQYYSQPSGNGMHVDSHGNAIVGSPEDGICVFGKSRGCVGRGRR